MTLPDLRGLLRMLSHADVEHVVVGGIAVVLHGHIRTTADLASFRHVLALAPARRFGPREAWLLKRGRNVSVTTAYGDLDVIRMLPGVPAYEVLAEDAEAFEIDGTMVSVASQDQLIAMKQARGEDRDRSDVEALRTLRDN